jgi:hypothetical protein
MLGVLFALTYLACLAIQIALVIAAFRTSLKLGVMAFFVPMYVVTFGNHRLATVHRRRLAVAWWLALAALVATLTITPR